MSNPYYAKAFEYIKNTDLNSLTVGKHFIDGDNLYVNIMERDLKTPQQARLEVHDKYIDIQVPLNIPESFGVTPRSECKEPDGEMNLEKDILFYKDPVTKIVTAQPGEAMTFAPDVAHAPLIGEGHIRKAVFKVKIV